MTVTQGVSYYPKKPQDLILFVMTPLDRLIKVKSVVLIQTCVAPDTSDVRDTATLENVNVSGVSHVHHSASLLEAGAGPPNALVCGRLMNVSPNGVTWSQSPHEPEVVVVGPFVSAKMDTAVGSSDSATSRTHVGTMIASPVACALNTRSL